MAQPSRLEELRFQRRRLVAESDELRGVLVQHFLEIEAATAWVERGFNLVYRTRALWPLLAALAGVLTARSGGGWLRGALRLVAMLRMAKPFLDRWRR